ncbi:diguanylate cyclase [Billgrantia azerbaijanica]|nr:diguanylate cyclase [Halomonas azerbaijanica]
MAGRVTVSLGVASALPADDGQSCEDLLERADSQLYRAKHQGRDQVAWAS